MTDQSPGRIRAGVVFWVLLTYILAALVWWFISLNRQNEAMYALEKMRLNTPEAKASPGFTTDQKGVESEYRKNKAKYIGEGSIFFLLILVGAAFVYRSVRRQFRMQHQQQNFMMAVTHELKTPISVTLLNLETLQKHHLAPDKQEKIIRNTVEETSRLNTLVNNILVSAQLDQSHDKGMREELNLSDLVNNCIRSFRKRYPERQYLTEIEPELELTGDPLHLEMLVNNLLGNATKYSPKESPVRIRLSRKNESILLEVLDEGPGIPDREKSRIFTKFYRIGNESTRKTQGTGLGLYLCRIIARGHNADISVTNNSPRGCNFAVHFK